MAVTKELIHGINLMMAGKEEGFNIVYKETYFYVYSRARSIMKNDEDAEELLQEVYVAMYRSIDTLQDVNNIYGWLKSVTYNQGMKLYSKKKDVLLSEDAEGIFDIQETEDKDVIPGEKMDEQESAEFVKGLIDELPESQRAVILAYYYDNMGVGDIAKMMSVSDGTIKSRLNYARQYIKKAYLEKGKEYSMYSVTGPVMLLAIEMMMKGYSFLPEKAAAAGAGLWSAVNTAGGTAEAAVTAASTTETAAAVTTEEAVTAMTAEAATTTTVTTETVAATDGTAAVTAGGTVATGTTSAVAVKVATIVVAAIFAVGGGIGFGLWKYRADKKKQQTVANTEQITEVVKTEDNGTESTQVAEEESTEITEEEATTEEVAAVSEFDKLRIRNYYAGLLRNYQCGVIWPDGTDLTSDILGELVGPLNEEFAITDVDGDGIEELLLHFISGPMASMRGGVFKYDSVTDTLITELEVYPSQTFYDNGIVVCGASHNQTLGMTIWPYTLYSYNAETKCYERIGTAACQDKEMTSDDSFPDDIDKDGDGTIYFIGDAEDNIRTVDQAEYDSWYNGYMENAKELPIEYSYMIDSDSGVYNYGQYTKEYLEAMCDMIEAEQDEQVYDAGVAFARTVFSPDNQYGAVCNENIVMSEIESKFGTPFECVYEVEDYMLKVGNAEFHASHLDAGSFSYYYEPISGLTIMGLKPGDSVAEAVEKLTRYGFRLKEGFDRIYISGDALGNFEIEFSEENGIITIISIWPYASYAG